MGGATPGPGLRLNSQSAHRTKPTEKLWRSKPADRDGRRNWSGNLEFVRLPVTIGGGVPAKRPETAAFPRSAFMDPGLPEGGWWCRQS